MARPIASVVRSLPIRPRATFSASPVSIDAVSEPAAPKASRQNCSRAEAEIGALLDEVHGDRAHVLVLFAVEHLQTVDDRADWADHVVADARTQQGGEVEGRRAIVKRLILWSMPVGLARLAAPRRRDIDDCCVADSLWPPRYPRAAEDPAIPWQGLAPATDFWRQGRNVRRCHAQSARSTSIALRATRSGGLPGGGRAGGRAGGDGSLRARRRRLAPRRTAARSRSPTTRGGDHLRPPRRACCLDPCRSSPRKRRRGRRGRDRRTVSSSSIRSTERGNSSPATANSRSMSRWSSAAGRSPAPSTRRAGAAVVRRRARLRLRRARRRRACPTGPPWRPIRTRPRAGAPGRPGEPLARRPRDRSVSRATSDRRAALARFLAEVLRRSPKDWPTSIPGSGRRWNGTPRPATPCCAPPGESFSMRCGAPLLYGKADADLRNGGFVAWGDPAAARAAAGSVNLPSTRWENAPRMTRRLWRDAHRRRTRGVRARGKGAPLMTSVTRRHALAMAAVRWRPVRPRPGRRSADALFRRRDRRQRPPSSLAAVSRGLAEAVQEAARRWGLPNAYVLGQEASGAFVGGLRYGEGKMYTRNAGDQPIFWQGPSLGFDAGADGDRTMMLVYNLPAVAAIYQPIRRHRRLGLFRRRLRLHRAGRGRRHRRADPHRRRRPARRQCRLSEIHPERHLESVLIGRLRGAIAYSAG